MTKQSRQPLSAEASSNSVKTMHKRHMLPRKALLPEPTEQGGHLRRQAVLPAVARLELQHARPAALHNLHTRRPRSNSPHTSCAALQSQVVWHLTAQCRLDSLLLQARSILHDHRIYAS